MLDPLWLRSAFELPLMGFTMLLLIFLINQLVSKRPECSSSFYVLFAFLCANNILSLLLARFEKVNTNYVGGRFPKYGWFTNFYKADHFVARANIVGDTFFAHYRYNAGLFLAANRLFALAFPKYYSVVWAGRSLKLVVVANYLLPLATTSLKVPVDAYYAHFNGSGNVLELVTGEDDVSKAFQRYSACIPAILGVGVTLTTFVLELGLLFCIRRCVKKLGASASDKQRDDVRLALFTIITFVVNLILLASAYWQVVLGFNTRSTMMDLLISVSYWSYDIQVLSPPIVLVAISKTMRQKLMYFYLYDRLASGYTTSALQRFTDM